MDDLTAPDAGQEFSERAYYYQLEYDFEGFRYVGLDFEKMGVGFLNDFKAFFRYDVLHQSTVDTRPASALAIFNQTNYVTTYGLNYQIRDNIVLKGEWHHHDPRQGGPDHDMYAASIAMQYG